MEKKSIEPTKKELVEILSKYYNKPKSYFNSCPKDGLIYLYDEEVLPDLRESNMKEIE